MSTPGERDKGLVAKLFDGFTEGLHFEFLKDMLHKSLIFFALAIISYLINFLINVLDLAKDSPLFHAPVIVVRGLGGLEQLLFWVDVMWFSLYVTTSTYRLTKAILQNLRAAPGAIQAEPTANSPLPTP